MIRIRCTGMGLIAALYVLAGRWGFNRLISADAEPNPFLEPRLWLVVVGMMLGAMGLVHQAHRAARPGETRMDLGVLASLLGFYGYMAASALWSPDASFAGAKLYELGLAVVMTVSFGLAALRQPADRVLDSFWVVVVAATGLLALAGVRQLLGGGGGARLAVLGGGPNVFARLMGLLALGSMYFWSRRGKAWLWIPVAATGAILALLTGSRGGASAIIAGLFTFLFVGRIPLRRLAVMALLATVAVAVAMLLTPLGQALNRAVEERFLKLTLKYGGGQSSETKVYLSGREHLYADAYRLGLDHPVAGAGLAAFPALGLGVYPHNIFLEVFCEGGTLGLAFFGGVLFAFAYSVFRGRRSIDGATVGSAVLMLIGSQSSGDLYDSRSFFLLVVMSSFTWVAERRSVLAGPSRDDSKGTAVPPRLSPAYPAVPGATP